MRYSQALLSQSNRYFSLVGLLLGFLLSISYIVFSYAFNPVISILLMMAISLLLTGAFHEDGLADMADGFGGGYGADQCLTIMKDSRIGTYGAVTLIMAFTLKFSLLLELSSMQFNQLPIILFALILSQSLSRAVAASLISQIPYVSDEQTSKSKPLASSQSLADLVILLFIGCLPLWFFPIEIIISCLLVLISFQWIFKRYLLKKIGGFTGDCLGAAQQISELLILLVLVFYFIPHSSNILAGLSL